MQVLQFGFQQLNVYMLFTMTWNIPKFHLNNLIHVQGCLTIIITVINLIDDIIAENLYHNMQLKGQGGQ